MEKVNENTQIFNNLGTTPDGSQLSTYKDLLGLASDMNQPDLVYKFMNLGKYLKFIGLLIIYLYYMK